MLSRPNDALFTSMLPALDHQVIAATGSDGIFFAQIPLPYVLDHLAIAVAAIRPHIYLYATASMLGASVLVLLSKASTASPQASMLAGIFVTLILRLAAIRWKLGLPVFSPKSAATPSHPDEPPSTPRD